jgi:hypothetical protein
MKKLNCESCCFVLTSKWVNKHLFEGTIKLLYCICSKSNLHFFSRFISLGLIMIFFHQCCDDDIQLQESECNVDKAPIDAIIAWEDDRNENDIYQIKARRIRRDGTFVGEDFTINHVSTGQQIFPQVAMAANGDFVVIWQDGRDGNYQVYARGFYADGTSKFNEFKVNSGGTNAWLWHPSISMRCTGEFVVAWADYRGDHAHIYMRGFDENGAELFPETKVSSDDGWENVMPVVAVSSNGHIVVAWQWGSGDATGDYEWRGGIETWEWHMWAKLKARGFAFDGSQTIEEFEVDTTLPNGQEFQASIDINENGCFVIAWDNFGISVEAAAFDTDGSRFGPPINICDPPSPGRCANPSVVLSSMNTFIITWEDDRDGNGYYEIRAKRFSLDGTSMSYPFINRSINEISDGQQINPCVSGHTLLENHIIVWQDDNNENGYYEVYVRGLALSANGFSFDVKSVSMDYHGQQVRPVVAYRQTVSLSKEL